MEKDRRHGHIAFIEDDISDSYVRSRLKISHADLKTFFYSLSIFQSWMH